MTKQFTADYTHIDIEEEICKSFGNEMAKEIDESIVKEIEMEFLVLQGWHKVKLERFYDLKHAVDIALWVDSNCGLHMRHGSTFVFKEAKDANWFKMRWL